jgi:hypothetical protein
MFVSEPLYIKCPSISQVLQIHSRKEYLKMILLSENVTYLEKNSFCLQSNKLQSQYFLSVVLVFLCLKINLERYFKRNRPEFKSKYLVGSTLRSDFVSKKKQKSEGFTNMVKVSYEIYIPIACS